METNDAQSSAEYDPATALTDVQQARTQSAVRLVTPWWYHPVLGAAIPILLLGIALASDQQFLLAMLLAVGLVVADVWAYTKLTGIWIGPGQAGPRSRRIWFGFAVLLVVLLLVAVSARVFELPWLGLAAALIGLTCVVLVGRRLDGALRAEIRRGDIDLEATR